LTVDIFSVICENKKLTSRKAHQTYTHAIEVLACWGRKVNQVKSNLDLFCLRIYLQLVEYGFQLLHPFHKFLFRKIKILTRSLNEIILSIVIIKIIQQINVDFDFRVSDEWLVLLAGYIISKITK
jgi:hypothetical protein